jgi:hypothetical protein
MLNPSTADADNDDPTIRRCIGYAKEWGFGGIYVVNLFGVRATNPKYLFTAPDPVGAENKYWCETAWDLSKYKYEACGLAPAPIIAAWGRNGSYMDMENTMLGWMDENLVKPMCLSKDGCKPRANHPLYLPKSLRPILLTQPPDAV